MSEEKNQDQFVAGFNITGTHIPDVEVEIDAERKRNLVLTGPNGSGKTTILELLSSDLDKVYPPALHLANQKHLHLTKILRIKPQNGRRPFKVYFEADRVSKQENVDGPKKTTFPIVQPNPLASRFHQHLVNLKAQKAFANDDGENSEVEKLDGWFNRFQELLSEIYNEPELDFLFDSKTFDFKVKLPSRKPFSINQLSRGYSAIFQIIAELILRNGHDSSLSFLKAGIVLIDEIETHLHIELQKRILPFLTTVFPNVQFIVTTHSPFVLTSIEDAVIFDLESRERLTDVWAYSSEAMVEEYFNSDKYSDLLKSRVNEYEGLLKKNGSLSGDEKDRLDSLEKTFSTISSAAAPELFGKIQQLKLDALLDD